ncbi:MAG: holo-ACP synthase [Bacteroidetes bacterium]|nr:holo-ACP synthase [Bacteroidota bacterium]MBT6687206.1 holo-ACP synthase [Bacteroidota bacterium]MBT7144571.1 holo-ACP synthase [Bacteroidota bacterium]MBT7490771.1 holo-ACP synthase [Bacteroidota bacterium]
MILGIGTDIIEVERFKKQIEKVDGLLEKLFTENEIRYCQSKKFPEQHLAARFAAKESFFKAIGTGWRYGLQHNEIEITNDELGKPNIKITGKSKEICEKYNIKNINVSLSHLKEIVNAVVIIETN